MSTTPSAPATDTGKPQATPTSAPSAKASARKAATPQTSAAHKPATKAPTPKRNAAKAVAAQPAATKPAATKPTKAEAKPKKPKLVRDSFTIPKDEYAGIDTLKERSVALGRPAKKSELLRAGLMALLAMSPNALHAALVAVPTIKTGRPKSDK